MALLLLLAVICSITIRIDAKGVVIAASAGGKGKKRNFDTGGGGLGGASWSFYSRSTDHVTPSHSFTIYMKNATSARLPGLPLLYYFGSTPYEEHDNTICTTSVEGSKLVSKDKNLHQTQLTVHYLCNSICCYTECCQLNYGLILLIVFCVAAILCCIGLVVYYFFCQNRPFKKNSWVRWSNKNQNTNDTNNVEA